MKQYILALALALMPFELRAEDDPRAFSGSCAELAYMSESQRRAMVDVTNEENFEEFCFPEDPFECSDFSPSLAKWGQLQTNDGGYWCRFTPK
jgi:hypothetical protein